MPKMDSRLDLLTFTTSYKPRELFMQNTRVLNITKICSGLFANILVE